MGGPATDTVPATLFARIRAKAVRTETSAAPLYPDPRGDHELRREIAGYLAMARGLNCSPTQTIVPGGYIDGLGLALWVLGTEWQKPWMAGTGFMLTSKDFYLAQLIYSLNPLDWK